MHSAEVASFFVGGSSNYTDIKMCGIPPEFEGRFLNRYYQTTTATGKVHVHLDVVQIVHAWAHTDTTALWKHAFASLREQHLIGGGDATRGRDREREREGLSRRGGNVSSSP